MSRFIRSQRCDGVLTITIDRPDRLGAINRAMAASLAESFAEARQDDAVRAIVLTGAGRGFCAGADLIGGEPEPGPTRLSTKTPLGEYTQVTVEIDRVDKPVVAAVNGVAAGGGLAFAAACDRRMAAESARFSAIFCRWGLVPDCGISYFLPRLVGVGAATHLLLTGEVIDAREARAIGLVEEVCPDAELAERAQRYAATLAAGASLAIDLGRRAVRRAFERDLEQSIAFEAWAQGVARSSADYREGRQAFREKRTPRFLGV